MRSTPLQQNTFNVLLKPAGLEKPFQRLPEPPVRPGAFVNTNPPVRNVDCLPLMWASPRDGLPVLPTPIHHRLFLVGLSLLLGTGRISSAFSSFRGMNARTFTTGIQSLWRKRAKVIHPKPFPRQRLLSELFVVGRRMRAMPFGMTSRGNTRK